MTDLDTTARSQAMDPSRSFCVSAPAGSGKTELLTQRLLALLSRVERPEQVLAITFTRKAAAEMRDRLLEKLDEAQKEIPVSVDHELRTRELAIAVIRHARRKNWSLDPEVFNLRTIDSLCGDLTRQMPIVSAIGGAVEVTDQYEPLFNEAVSQLMKRVELPDETGLALRALLFNFDNNWDQLRGLLVQLLGRRGDWGRRIGMHHSPHEAEKALRETVSDLIAGVLLSLNQCLAEEVRELEMLANIAADNLGFSRVSLTTSHESLNDWRQASDVLLKKDGDWRSPKGINKSVGFPTTAAEHKQRLCSLIERLQEKHVGELLKELRRLPIADNSDASWQLVLHLSHLLPILQAELLLVFQKRGKVDYTHIALAAADALGTDENPTDLALRLDYQIEHILIDEFQDTSDQQFHLLQQLTRGWKEHNEDNPQPRTLFLVGDGMQSIYGFRYANVSLFLQARDRGVGGLQLQPLLLERNFRSQAGIVDWVNSTFQKLFPAQDDLARGRVSHSKAIAVRPALTQRAVAAHVFASNSGIGEANFIAQTIVDIRHTEPEASIAVLIRARRHAQPIMDALRGHCVRFVGRDLEPLADTATISDLMSLCRWLANPADELAALALLRAPFCGLQLADIHAVWSPSGELRRCLTRALPNLSTEAAARVTHLVAALDWAVDHRDRLSLPVWIEQTWLRLGGDLCTPCDAERNAQRFFDLLREAEAISVGLDIDWLARRVQTLFAEHPEDGSAIEIMTLHKSKGLQFDYVFMPQPDKSVGGTDKPLLRWHLHVGAGRDYADESGLLVAADDRQASTAPSLYNYLSWLQAERDTAELRRLLYVGVTRAKKHVWLTAEANADQEWPNWPSKNSPMGVLKPVVEADTEFHSLVGTDELSDAGGSEPGSGWLDSNTANGRLARLPSAVLRPTVTSSPEATGSRGLNDAFKPGNIAERLLGSAVHRGLEVLASLPVLPESASDQARNAIGQILRSGGLNGSVLTEKCLRAIELIDITLNSEQGRWVLSHRPIAHNEWILWELGQEPTQRIIDRYFFDEASHTHYVIDYKTSQPSEDETPADFVAREVAHYAQQLADYRRLLNAKGLDPIKTCLFFCALGELVPVDSQPSKKP